MTPSQQFTIAIATLILSGVVTPLIAMFSVWLSKQNQHKVAELDEKVVESHKQINSRMDDYMKALEEKSLLLGQNQGRAALLAEQALRDFAPVPAPTPNEAASTPTAANPLLTEDKAKEFMKNVEVDKGKGWSPKT